MKNNIKDKDLFELLIDFESGGDPSRVFKSMSDLLDVLQSVDQTLCEVIGLKIKRSLQLEGVHQDCFKSVIRNHIDDLPDEDLREKNNKQAIGSFLVEAKFVLLQWCAKTRSLSSDKEVAVLEKQLVKIAEKSKVNKIPAYQAPNRGKLLKNINVLRKSTRYLIGKDTASFACVHGNVSVHDGIEISDVMVKEVLVKQTIQKRNQALLQVKRPDYLGHAKWLLKHQGNSIDVVVLDDAWLEKFQNKEITVQPGDSLRGTLLQHIAFGHDMEIISIRYELEVVDGVVEGPKAVQSGFDI